MSRAEIESWFPGIVAAGFEITSPETEDYNCIAWAGDDDTEKWDPDEHSGRYWPHGVPRSLKLDSFIKLYEYEGGYTVLENDDQSLVVGIEKIAIFFDSDKEVTHAARQKEDGTWTSKLGDFEDITHKTLESLCGHWPAYGKVAKILRRKRPVRAV
jgi:hypothetical protein